ncbi:hypothetical protein BLNAU_12146 [Blattamonas nauphoetae]|uniref:Uncharacterized protein n=1 Tax=Blattamonas nauphoetae TaxID=2049346 RepID=A0ABQ9XN93_9EUKA|nr:hypothetical protein BLNAU_12146 [Blattamonas nauphoetae]
MLPTQVQSTISNTDGSGHTSDGLMEEFRRCESEFKNGDETVQHKIALSVFTTISSGITNKNEGTMFDWDSEWIAGEIFGTTVFGLCKHTFGVSLFFSP